MKEFIHVIGTGIELSGVMVILLGALWAAVRVLRDEKKYDNFRMNLGRSILLGLELLVAGDIINTVAVEPTMDSVLLLGLIVFIRTFLSFSLSIELEGKLPWRKKEQ